MKTSVFQHTWMHEILNNKILYKKYVDKGYGKSKAQKKLWFLKLYIRISSLTCIELDCEHLSRWEVLSKYCWPYLIWVGLWAFVKVSKHLWSSSPICEALPSPLLIVCPPYGYSEYSPSISKVSQCWVGGHPLSEPCKF